MAEKLIPLNFPPGFKYAGTPYQSKDRWREGNLVRFHEGTIQPVGGWVQRTFTGAGTAGTPNAMHSWVDNDSLVWTALGTTSGLYVYSGSNAVTDITPTTGAVNQAALPVGTWQWDLTNFGDYLVAVLRTTQALVNTGTFADEIAENVYIWTGTGRATSAYAQTAGPTSVWGVCATPERFVVLLAGGDPGSGTRSPNWVG
jgi:hypothetical protein